MIAILAWLALFVAACGGSKPPVVRFRDAAYAQDLRLSATGRMAAYVVKLSERFEVRLRQRAPDNRQVASGTGTIVGVPSESDVLVVDGERIGWLREGRSAAVGLPTDGWRFVAGTVDHDASTATLAYATVDDPGTVHILEIDTAALRVRGSQDVVATSPASCRASGHGSTLYVWCLEPTDATERWRISRHDGAKTAWTSSIEMPSVAGTTDMRGSVTGDGSVLVLVHGGGETSRTRFGARRVMFVDARDHSVRDLRTSEPLYFLDELVPVPGRPEIAYVRWVYSDYDGIVVIDARAGSMRVAVQPDTHAVPLVLAVQPDGMFVIP